MPEMMEVPPDVLSAICGFCGIALYNNEIAAEFSGNMIDYGVFGNRGIWNGSYVLCGECWLRVKESLVGDIDAAVEKRQRTLGDT